jgi:putative FmdB family regulatory protein
LPLYPYRCTQCGHRFEKIQSFKAEPEKVCPQCGGPVERVLTAPGLQFKGAGWYVNDYAPKSSSASSDSSAGESKSEARSSEATAEKPAAAPAKDAGSGAGSSPAGSGSASSGSSGSGGSAGSATT